MPAALIIIGLVLGMAAVNDKIGDLGTLIKSDFFGSKQGDYGFIVWAAAIIIVAAVLRVLDLPEAGKLLIVLIVLAYLLGNANIPQQILTAIESAGSVTGQPVQSNAPAYPNNLPGATGAQTVGGGQ
jgi:hypothetical protein